MKRISALLLTLALILGSFSAVFAANPQEHNVMLGTGKDETYNLIVLGDSNTTGLGLYAYQNGPAYYNQGFLTRTEKAYPDLLAKEIEQKYGVDVNMTLLTIPSTDYETLRILLDPSLPLDKNFASETGLFASKDTITKAISSMDIAKENNWDVAAWSREERRDFLSPYYMDAVETADQIVIDCGMSSAIFSMLNSIESDEAPDFSIYTDNELLRELCLLRQDLSAKLKARIPEFDGKDKAEELAKLVDAVLFTYLGETLNYDLLIKRIRQLNADAEITVMSLVSPFSTDFTAGMFGQSSLPVGIVLNLLAEVTNYHHQVLSAYAGTVKYADCNKLFPVSSFADELVAEEGDIDKLTPSTKDLYIRLLSGPFISADGAPLYALDLKDVLGDPADPANHDNYENAMRRLSALASHKKVTDFMADPVSEFSMNAAAMLGQYVSGQKEFNEFTEEEQDLLIGTAGFWTYMGYKTSGLHPGELGHQQKAKAVMNAIGSSLSARQAKAVETHTKMETAKFEIRNAVKDQLREMADRRFEMKMDFAEGLKNSLEVSASNMRNAFKNLLLAPILLPFGK